MADESLTDARSMRRLLERKACTAVNVRISKCGGIIAARNRCEEALASGLKVQIGCQVGESSLLSAAQLALTVAVQDVTFIEGCFGCHLLREDPASPVLQFGYAGRPPKRPQGSGLGVALSSVRPPGSNGSGRAIPPSSRPRHPRPGCHLPTPPWLRVESF